MITDKNGKISLGKLLDATSVEVEAQYGGDVDVLPRNTKWDLRSQLEDRWTLSDKYNIIEGETVEIPVNFYEQRKNKITDGQSSL